MSNEKPMAKVSQALNQLKPIQIPDNENVRNKFISIYESVHGKKDGARVYEVEKFHFIKKMNEDPNLQECTPISIYGAFVDMAAQGMSVDPSKKLGYILWDNFNVGTRENPKWEKRAKFQIQARGELAIRQQQGQVLRADNPVIIYEGDHFRKYLNEAGQLQIEYEAGFKSSKIVGCFLRLILPDGQVDFKHLDEVKIESLKAASAKKNKGIANPNYSSVNGGIDPGFLETKTIKHAFTSYPKVKLKGAFSELESERVDNEEAINYELDAPFADVQVAHHPVASINHDTGEITPTEATIQMTEQPSSPGTPVSVDAEFDF